MRFFLLGLAIVLCLQVKAQRYSFVNYSLEEGLPQSQVSDICQDRFGYLWIGTETGLSRFDGVEFRNFSTDDGLPDNEIGKILLDRDSNLWVATPKGLARKTQTGFSHYLFPAGRDYGINDLTEWRSKIYLVTDEGLMMFENDEFNFVDSVSSYSKSIRTLVGYGDSVLYCGSRNGLFTYDGHEIKPYVRPGIDSLNISDLFVQGDRLIISTYGSGLIIYNIRTGEIQKPAISLNRVRAVFATSQSILCATKNGAVEIAHDEIFYYNVSNGLEFENIRSVFIDREGNLWFGSDGKGLFKQSGKSLISFIKGDGLSSDAVMGISQGASGDFFFGTYDAGVTCWNESGDTVSIKIYDNELRSSTIWATQTIGNSCWIGSSGGVDFLVNGKLQQNAMTKGISSKIRTFAVISENQLFAAGSGGVFFWDNDSVSVLFHDQKLDVNKIVVRGNQLFMATNTGLYVSDIYQLSGSASLIDLPENNVRSITPDKSGNVWIGTNSSGIYVLLENNRLVSLELDATDNRSKTILGLISSSDGSVWASTLNGVYQVLINPGDEMGYKINHFGRPEGLSTLECNQNALFEDRDHRIWVGTSEGLVRIDPALNDELFHFRTPELLITGVRLFMEEFDYNSFPYEANEFTGVPLSITLPYNKNHLTFDFIGINLKDPEGVRYEYRLLGAEEDWSPVSSTSYATYSFISHGEYDFEVRATNQLGNWSAIERMHVIILPPFWLTWWFISLVTLVGLVIIWIIFQVRIRAIKQKQENEQLGFKNRLLFLEQQSLNASMNRHFIFNSLNSIQYFINSSNKLAANKYLTSFAKLIRKNLDSSQANNFIVTLREEMERIELYLSLEKMRFEGKFEYVIDLDEEIDTDSIEIPSMILQPFVENSIIHGVLPLQRPGRIDIRVYLEYGFLVFEVVDNGVGIDNSLQLKKNRQSANEDHESMGMEITNRRIELLRKLTGENLMIIGPFQVNNEAGDCLGTRVIIKISVDHELGD